MTEPLVSICIPTYGREEILKETLNSIYSQNEEESLFEICISDNSPTDETKSMLDACFSNYHNIIYRKSTCEGYYNSIEALKLGNGKFLKLHNNYTCFKKNIFKSFLEEIKKYDENTVLFFLSNAKNGNTSSSVFDSFDTFMNYISHLSTWSSSFGIWKSDFSKILQKTEVFDKMFPHTSLLFLLHDKDKYVVSKTSYFVNQNLKKKSGYNLPETFGTRFLGMCDDLYKNEHISVNTYEHIKKDILLFIADYYAYVNYFKDRYGFSYENWEATINSLYGQHGVDFMKKHLKRMRIKCLIKRILNKY